MRLRRIVSSGLLVVAAAIALSGCISQVGQRRFATPPEPAQTQNGGMTVLDDGSIVFTQDRLEISLQVLRDDFLNRQFAASSNKGTESTNPYTYGDWQPWGQEWTPQRFTVVLLKVKNYEYPKVFIDPNVSFISSDNDRIYNVLDQGLLEDYFSPYLRAYAGTQRRAFEAITDQLMRTVYPPDMIFSGQETSGYIVFPTLHNDVSSFAVHVPNVVTRFDYKGEPVETIDLEFKLHRDIYMALQPREAAQ
ncbi:MAG: hypothetical protein ACKVJG_07895 [Candidatus Latescibacterota bacterium]|jgi:hypothetical protein